MQNNLHILSKNFVPQAVTASPSSDAILLINEAVYLLLNMPTELQKRQLYILADDLHARGVTITNNAQIKLIDYARFVELVTEYKTNTTW